MLVLGRGIGLLSVSLDTEPLLLPGQPCGCQPQPPGLLTSPSRLTLPAGELGILGQKKAVAVQPVEQTLLKALPN